MISAGNLGTVNQNQTAEIKQEEPATEEAVEEAAVDEKDIQPVGQEYIEENKSEDGKIISFNCKLCECRFNDPNAKDMHMKGRRHRFAYKKKVNPDLVVDMKPSLKQRKMLEEKLRRQQIRDEYLRRREEINQLGPMGPMHMDEDMMMYWEERRRYEEECEYFEWYRRYGRGPGPAPIPRGPFAGPPGPMMMYPGPQRRPDSSDDKHVLAHHTTIYPKEQELLSVQKIVSHTEKALKYVSDSLAEAGKFPRIFFLLSLTNLNVPCLCRDCCKRTFLCPQVRRLVLRTLIPLYRRPRLPLHHRQTRMRMH